MFRSSFLYHPPRDVASNICVAICACENCEPVAARDNRCGFAVVVAEEGGVDIFNLVHEIWRMFFGVIEPNSGPLHGEVCRSFLEKQRVEACVVVTIAVFDLSWLPAVSAVVW